jgi:mannonate dehydratase
MDRRQLFGLAAATAITAGACTTAPSHAAATHRVVDVRKPSSLKLGCQSGPSTEEHFAYFARFGVRNICASPKIADPARLYPTVEELGQLQDMAERHGLSVDLTDSVLLQSTHIDRERNPSIMLARSPQRDRDIEAFQNLIRNCAKVGLPAVKYNMSILGVLRNVTEVGRGGVIYRGWDMATAKADPPLTAAGRVDADAFWERITYFLDRVVPVANEYKIRIACHPQDPGVAPEGYQGVDRVLGTIDGLKKFITIRESEFHGLNFCQGTISENLADPAREIFDVIRYFGTRKKIFNVHFRNIRGGRNRFVETFHDEGDVDMFRAMLTYKEVGYDGMLMPDHVPTLPAPGAGDYGYNLGGPPRTDDGRLEAFAFAYGYIRGLIQAVEHVA